jgi:alpha-1,6-mannosyltransferase
VRVFALGLLAASLFGAACLAQQAVAYGPVSLAAIAAYVLVTVGLFACYACIIRLARSHRLTPGAIAILLGMPLPIWLALSITPPALSIDVYSYLGHGHQVNAGDNPYRTPVKDIASHPYGRELSQWGWLPVHGVSPYGPIWTRAEQAAQAASPDVGTQMRLLKVPVAIAGLCAGWLIWAILGVLAPAKRLLGTLLYLWNPLVVLELAGEGHNDGVMLACVLFAVLLIFTGRDGRGMAALAAGALIKLNALVVAAPLALLALRRGDRRGSLIAQAVAVGVIAVAAGLWLYGGLWAGVGTFEGLREHGRPHVTASTSGVLLLYLSRIHDEARSAQAVSWLTNLALAAIVCWSCAGVTDRPSAVRAMGVVSLAVVLLGPVFWPWYMVAPVALLALCPTTGHVWTILLVSFFGRLAAPVDRLRLNGLMDWQTAVVFTTVLALWVPMVILAARAAWGWTRTPERHYAPVRL